MTITSDKNPGPFLVGIGAFSLLPSDDHSGSIWLTNFLMTKLEKKPDQCRQMLSESHYVEEAPRIPYHGTKVTRFNDMVIVANQLGSGRDQAYIDKFKCGEASFYHTKYFAFQRQQIEQHVIHEARYFAVAVNGSDGKREIEFIYPILDSEKIKREKISADASGSPSYKNPDEIYWLFTLGNALRLKSKLTLSAERRFRIKLASREELSHGVEWDQLQERYTSVSI